MSVLFSPWGNQQFFDENGDPAVGWKIYTYTAGSSIPLATYTSSTGTTPQTNPVVLDALGFPTGGQIWLTDGSAYKLVLTDENGVIKKTEDGIAGVSNASSTISQWQASGVTPTYINASSFTLPGDQTTDFHVGRRLQFTTTVGAVYGTILTSAHTALTTVTMTMDSGMALDSGLSAVNHSILRADKLAEPQYILGGTGVTVSHSSAVPTIAISLPRGHIAGLTLSNNATDATNDIDIAVGQAVDSTNAYIMTLDSVMTKRLDAAWAAGTGNGGLDTGAIANTTYHVFLIRKDSDGTIDALFSTSVTAPTMPAGYTYKRRIGSIIRASAEIIPFSQDGDEFLWKNSFLDLDGVISTTAQNLLLRTPLGIKTRAIVNVLYANATGANFGVYISSPDQTDEGTSTSSARITALNPSTTSPGVAVVTVRTNTSSQVRIRSDQATNTTRAGTIGYIDTRGKNA